jgi:DNA polymerase V
MTLTYCLTTAYDHRVPTLSVPELKLSLPLYASVQAGFPSPAEDYVAEVLDLNDYLVKDPACTFFVRVQGESMIEAGIYPGDILVVDRSVEARHDDVVVAFINQHFTVKRLYRQADGIRLVAENAAFPSLLIGGGDELIIWGVVGHVLHKPTKLT